MVNGMTNTDSKSCIYTGFLVVMSKTGGLVFCHHETSSGWVAAGAGSEYGRRLGDYYILEDIAHAVELVVSGSLMLPPKLKGQQHYEPPKRRWCLGLVLPTDTSEARMILTLEAIKVLDKTDLYAYRQTKIKGTLAPKRDY